MRHLVRIANDAALGAAEGDIDDGALPGHPAGQGADFIEGDVGRVADAALARAASDGVLHAEAGEDLEGAVVHGNRDVKDDFAVGIAQDLPEAFIEVELLGGDVETRGLRLPGLFSCSRETVFMMVLRWIAVRMVGCWPKLDAVLPFGRQTQQYKHREAGRQAGAVLTV